MVRKSKSLAAFVDAVLTLHTTAKRTYTHLLKWAGPSMMYTADALAPGD